MRVLFLSPRESWPPQSGARLRDLYFARALAEKFQLTYIYFSPSPQSSQVGLHLSGAQSVIPVRSPKKYTIGKVVRGIGGRLPLPVVNYTSLEMALEVAKALQDARFEVVHLDSIHLTGYLPLIRQLAPETRVVLNWHNIESELMARYAKTCPSLPRRSYARWTAKRLERLEANLLISCFGHVVCSERERTKLTGWIPGARVIVAENGVDTEHFRPIAAPQVRNRLIFVGQMSYHGNADGILWFAHEVWPAILARFPHLILTVIGSDPGPAILALRSQERVEVTGTVPDVLPFYASAWASIVPLRTGGGTRLKILESMACGLPVVSTEAGAEGLRVEGGSDLLLAGNDPAEWVSALQTLSEDSRRATLVDRARKLVCSEYDWNAIGERLAATYGEWGESRQEAR